MSNVQPLTVVKGGQPQSLLNSIRLTRRELEVLNLISRGLASQSVAESLFLSKRTVDFHLANIFAKFQVRSRLHAVHRANRMGLLTFEP